MVAKAKSKAKAKPKMADKIYTNSELAKLNQLFKSPSIGDLQLSYKTSLAISKLAQKVEDALKPVAKVEQEYIADGQADADYQEFIASQNKLRAEKPDNLVKALDEHAEANKHLVAEQVARTKGFQEALNADADIEIELLTEDEVPDLFTSDLAHSEWAVLGMVLEQ